METLGLHFRWDPGTDNEVINIVIHLRRKTVPQRAKNLRNNMNLKQNYNKVLIEIIHKSLYIEKLIKIKIVNIPILMKYQNNNPYNNQYGSCPFTHMETPWNVRNII